MNHAAPLTPDDPRLLALALGDITDPAERAALEAQVAASPELRAALDSHRAFAGELRVAFAKEPTPFVNPAAIAAKAMSGGAPAAHEPRRRALAGSFAGTRAADRPASRLLAFGGFGAAAAACLALVLITRRPATSDATVVAMNQPRKAPVGVSLRMPSARGDLASLAAGMAGLSGASNEFLPAGRAPLALAAPNARAYAAAFSKELAAGRRPAAASIRVDGLVNAYIGARPVVPGARPVLLEVALTDAPWNPDRRLLRVTVRAQGMLGEIVAKNAVAGVDFDPAGVKSWRLLGHRGAIAAPGTVALRGGETVTTLYEIEPTAAAGPTALANIAVRYARADRTGAETATAAPTAADRKSLADTDADTRFAAGLAAYAMNLGENPAAGLASAAGDDSERLAFAALAR